MMIYDYDNDEQLKKVWPAATDKAREEHTIMHDADRAIHSIQQWWQWPVKKGLASSKNRRSMFFPFFVYLYPTQLHKKRVFLNKH